MIIDWPTTASNHNPEKILLHIENSFAIVFQEEFIYLSNYNAWYDGTSNVNQFRILIQIKKFNHHLPLLKDTSFLLMGGSF